MGWPVWRDEAEPPAGWLTRGPGVAESNASWADIERTESAKLMRHASHGGKRSHVF
jgi:hypothetical protein